MNTYQQSCSNNHKSRNSVNFKRLQVFLSLALIAFGLTFSSPTWAQNGSTPNDGLAPPALGEETKGEESPAKESNSKQEVSSKQTKSRDNEIQSTGFLGSAKITESRRRNGQIYRIELEHSSGSKQYIEELDSDGKIESKSNDIEETPNLAKWKIGSW